MTTQTDKARYRAKPETAERRAKTLTMRNAGATFAQIGANLGVSEQQARNDYARAIKDFVRVPAGQMVDRQRAILLDIMRVEYPAAMDPGSPRHYQAQGKILEALKHEADLFGLYQPKQLSVSNQVTEQEFARQALELLNVLGPAPLLELVRASDDPRVAVEAEVVEAGDGWSNLEDDPPR
jgi:hypothetical protein